MKPRQESASLTYEDMVIWHNLCAIHGPDGGEGFNWSLRNLSHAADCHDFSVMVRCNIWWKRQPIDWPPMHVVHAWWANQGDAKVLAEIAMRAAAST